MISLDQARTLKGKTMKGAGGENLGSIGNLYADRTDGDPTFATVNTGSFGGKSSFVPLAQATLTGDDVTVPYDKALVEAAPNVDEDSDLEPQEEERLYRHYGLTAGGYDNDRTETFAGTTTEGTGNTHGTVGHDTSGPTTDDAMTRSEERLHVGTEKHEAGRARLRKYIVSETETRTVPVSHEEITIEREPITDGNVGNALDGPALSEEEHEVVLTEETPVVAKETVPVERVRVGKEQVTENVQVTEEVRKEQIETEGVEGGTNRR